MVLREENIVGEYFEQVLDLLVGMKNGYVNRTRVRIGRIHQLLNTGCMEHVDFVSLDDVEFNVDVFEELDMKTAHLKSKASLRALPLDDEFTIIDETAYKNLDDHELFSIISKADPDQLKETAIAIALMIKRYTGNFVVQNETLYMQMEKAYRASCQLRLWSLVRYCASYLGKTVTSLAPAVTSLLVRGKLIIIGIKSCVQITVSTPQTPNELSATVFNSCRSESEPQAAVFQQELIIACADLVSFDYSVFKY
jgi:phosphorylase kinase alpha/beta subunit